MSEELQKLKNIIEGAVLASAKPISFERIGKLFEDGTQPAISDMKAAFEALREDYQGRGIELQEVASGTLHSKSTLNLHIDVSVNFSS